MAMTSQWPDNCDANTWQVISNSLDIDFIHDDIHGRSCKNIHLYMVKQFKIESSDIFQILEYFQNFDGYFINRYLTVWGFTIVFPQVQLLKKC